MGTVASRGPPSKDAFAGHYSEQKGLLPLLRQQLRSVDLPPDFATYLRSAAARESARHEAYQAACRDVLRAVTPTALEVLVVSGEPLARLVYPGPATRHTHGLRLVVRGASEEEAARERLLGSGVSHIEGALYRHGSGLDVHVGSRLWPGSMLDEPTEQIWANSRKLDLWGFEVRAPAPAFQALDAVGRILSQPARENLRWLCDLGLLQRTGFDEAVFLAAADAIHLGPASAWLLAQLMGMRTGDDDAPTSVAPTFDLVGAELAIQSIAASSHKWALLRAIPTPAAKLHLVRSVAFPTRAFMAVREGGAGFGPYAKRLVRNLRRSGRSALRRL